MPQRIYNFSAGPAILPQEVLSQAAQDIVNFNNRGMGLIEMSHRGKDFMAVMDETTAIFAELFAVPDTHQVLFLQGGASTQFALVPMNLQEPGQRAVYLHTGVWSKKAIKEAQTIGRGPIEVAFSSEATAFNRVPRPDEYTVASDASYLYLVSNNTIYGTQYHEFPISPVPMVCDMSSDILSRPIDVSRFALIFAGAQKNMGPAGVTVVVVKKDLLQRTPNSVPIIFRYQTHADQGSMYNTPPCFSIHVVGLVLKWLKKLGGVQVMEQMNRDKAALLYRAIDSSDFYRGHAEVASRSSMNITFNLPTPELEAVFIAEAATKGFDGLKGHRSVGGCRASIYNAFPREGVEKLVVFMQEFERKNG